MSTSTLLPQPRQLLTSLIDSISRIPLSPQPPPPPPAPAGRATPTAAPHALSLVPLTHRHLLTTLHVLLPTLLLPALDLLDRRLVTRLILDGASGALQPVYAVRSARPPSTHPRRGGGTAGASASGSSSGGGGGTYVVRLGSWNCTCAAFAFAAFPPAAPASRGGGAEGAADRGDGARDAVEMMGSGEGEGDGGGNDAGWSFGGSSLDGTEMGGAGVPCCKHLLACLLVERWDAAFGEVVVVRRVGREEMAGIMADV